MMKILCLVYFLSVIISVLSNPVGQIVQSRNACQPISFSNPGCIPVVIQKRSNTNPYPQDATGQVPAGYTGPLGETLNQILMNRILSNPSLQKMTDPNTKLYNQNGEEVQRQVSSTGVNVPNVINNYFIVPPEFFNLNETIGKNNEVFNISKVDKGAKRPRRRKLKKRIIEVEPIIVEDEEEEVVIKRRPRKRQKQHKHENMERKRKLIDNNNESDELIKELDGSQETIVLKDQEGEHNKRKHRIKNRKKERISTPLIDESVDDFDELQDVRPSKESRREKEIKRPEQTRTKPKSKVLLEESGEIITEVINTKVEEKVIKSSSDRDKDSKEMIEMPETIKSKKKQREEASDKNPDDKILGNIEIPTDVSSKVISENRPTRDSKRNVAKKESEQKNTNASRKSSPNITPFPDDVLKNFFPHMPMGDFYNPNSNYPYNFDQYYQYLNPVRNSNANRRKPKRKNQNIKNNDANSNTHTIEIKLKPKKKENITETPVVTTERPEEVNDFTVSIEVEQSTESIEQVTSIPMEMPHKVFPVNKDEASSSRESYETFSKLEDLHDFITPELGTEDEVLPMYNNGIINDYYPVFDVDVYYDPYAEKAKTLEDDRYFYETGKEEKLNRERRKLDRYEDSRVPERDTDGKRSQTTNTKRKLDPDINKFDHTEYLDHISTFSDFEKPENDIIKSDDGIRRVKVPPRNTRVKPESIETVFAGSKVAKYGVPSDETIEDSPSAPNLDENSYSSGGHTTYVVAKSLGCPEDYW